MILEVLLVIAVSYLLGAIPFGYLLYRLWHGGDIRSVGSGNIGATNVFRGAGAAAGAVTLLLDAAKGYLAVLIAGQLTAHSIEWMSLAAFASIAGHVFPVFLGFRGGKGVATGLGAFLGIAPVPALICAGIFLLISGATRYVSVASIAAVAAFPVIWALYRQPAPFCILAAIVSAGLIVSRHRSNIQRLRTGSERRIHLGGHFHFGRTSEH